MHGTKRGIVRVVNQNKTICRFKISLASIQRLFLAGLVALVLSSFAATGASAQASNIYITQDGGGNGVCSSNVHTPAWFNNSANWGTGGSQIGPGTIVHLCGTITTSLAAQGDGASGRPWTLLFEPGAKISHAFCGDDGGMGCLNISNHGFFVIDGGSTCGWINGAAVPCNGIIEATANGTNLANHSSLGNGQGVAVNISNSHDLEFKNITIQNIYVRVPNSGDHNGALSEGFWGHVPLTNIHIHHVILHDLHWGIATTADYYPINNLEYDHFYSYNLDHGVGIGMAGAHSNGFLIHDFHIGSSQVWDLATTDNHHDGIHFYGGADGITTGVNTGIQIYNGLFDGDWGFSNTANIFFEDGQNATIFNNLFYSSSGSYPLNNGVINNGNGPSPNRSVKFYNNTVIWNSPNAGSYIAVLYGSVDWRNNVIVDASTTGGASLTAWGGTRSGTWDYDVYAAVNPSTGLFGQNSSCCTWTYAQWKANTGADAHSPAIGTGTMSIASTGIPNAGSPVIGVGTNLSSLGIAALNMDRNGNPRPSSGSWDAGAFNSGASVTTTKPSPPAGLTVVVH
jgi:hypothetical protein